MLKYLTHENAPIKNQYPEDEVTSNYNWKVEKAKAINKSNSETNSQRTHITKQKQGSKFQNIKKSPKIRGFFGILQKNQFSSYYLFENFYFSESTKKWAFL